VVPIAIEAGIVKGACKNKAENNKQEANGTVK
jgi:hypothetical protein